MNVWSLVFSIIACVCFALDFLGGARRPPDRWYSGSLIALGLLFFTLAFMFQFLIVETDPITF